MEIIADQCTGSFSHMSIAGAYRLETLEQIPLRNTTLARTRVSYLSTSGVLASVVKLVFTSVALRYTFEPWTDSNMELRHCQCTTATNVQAERVNDELFGARTRASHIP